MSDIGEMIYSHKYGKTSCEDFVEKFRYIKKTQDLYDEYATQIADIRMDCQVDRFEVYEDESGRPMMRFAIEDSDCEYAFDTYNITQEGGFNYIQLDAMTKAGTEDLN